MTAISGSSSSGNVHSAFGAWCGPGDFRTESSGRITYQSKEFDERCMEMTFDTTDKLAGDCVALDFVFDSENSPRILEASYGFIKEVYDPCEGFWDRGMNWHPGDFDPQGWMVNQTWESVP